MCLISVALSLPKRVRALTARGFEGRLAVVVVVAQVVEPLLFENHLASF